MRVILNPGIAADPGYYNFADIIVTAENDYSLFSTSQLSFSSATPASKQAVILHGGPTVTDANLVHELVANDHIKGIFLTSEEYTSIPTD
ncbi:hypothetical protein V5O48_004926 [Marasmius crinis-equi]|uniref:Uncharacterized protein n=1 Tax=Marasmius crinis-equi TaxID=585013 RepID=A0ABR3FNP0_9AGAR